MSMLVVSKNTSTGLSAYVDQATGQAYLSATLITQISGIHHATLDKLAQSEGVQNCAYLLPEVLTEGGTQGAHKIYLATDFALLIYAWEPSSEALIERKRNLIKALLKAGAVSYVHQLCGYERVATRVLPELNLSDVTDKLLELDKSNLSASVKQNLIDTTYNEFLTSQNTALLTPGEERWLGCVQKAEELGFKTDNLSRRLLGMMISDQGGDELKRKKEKRLCLGQYRSIWVYQDCEELGSLIETFFSEDLSVWKDKYIF